jgi:formylglycine-generating enzyme required for sulfatase activity
VKQNWTPSQRTMMRKAGRLHALRGAVVVVLLAVAAVTGRALWERVDAQRQATEAAGLVRSLLDAETPQVPGLLAELAGYRDWADPLLREEHAKAAAPSRQKLHTSLALLPADSTQVDYLAGRLLDAKPGEVPVIRDALAPHQEQVVAKLWAVAGAPAKDKEKQRLRAAAALAKYDPDNPRWAKVQEAVADDLVQEPAVYLKPWLDALRGVRLRLLVPLAAIFGTSDRREVERAMAMDVLIDYAADQAPVLADAVMNADARQFATLLPLLQARGEQGLPALIGEIDRKLPAEVPSSDERREQLAKRQANAAAALLKMKHPARAWAVLKHSADPRARSYLIHRLSPLGADPASLSKRLDEEPDVTIRRALLLSLGTFPEKELPPAARTALVPKLQALYQADADPGLHAAAEWLLRTWQQEAWLKKVNDAWAGNQDQRAKRLHGIEQALARDKEKAPPQWYVNGQGQTLVVIPVPVEFVMGSPVTEKGRQENERQHPKRIGRTFAVAATPVTKEQFLRFRPTFDHSEFRRYPEPTCPIGGVTWYEAAAYCNWLSQQEDVPEEQWCYAITGQEIRLKANYLGLGGYRLPTEAEMEYATRAGALTSRYYGETDELLAKYAWYVQNAQDKTWPVGALKPNDWGLFDVQGNVFTWCQESYKTYPQGSKITEDKEDSSVIISTVSRVLRGGAFYTRASLVRSAQRSDNTPANRVNSVGFRPARTLLLDKFTALPSTPFGGENKK